MKKIVVLGENGVDRIDVNVVAVTVLVVLVMRIGRVRLRGNAPQRLDRRLVDVALIVEMQVAKDVREIYRSGRRVLRVFALRKVVVWCWADTLAVYFHLAGRRLLVERRWLPILWLGSLLLARPYIYYYKIFCSIANWLRGESSYA